MYNPNVNIHFIIKFFDIVHKLIGLNIRLFRIKYGISIEDVSEETKLTKDTLYKVERGVLFGKSFVLYILYLKDKNADLNEIFSINNNELLKK